MSTRRNIAYTRHHGVQKHRGNVFDLAVTSDGATLATAGSQGTRLWRTDTMQELKRPSGKGSRGPTLRLLFARHTDEPGAVLYSGTQQGHVFCWREHDGVFEETLTFQIDGEITGLGFDPSGNRLCICCRNDVVQSWIITKDPDTGRWSAQNVFSQEYPCLSPQAVIYSAYDSSRERDLFVFGLQDTGPVYTVHGKTGEVAGIWTVGAMIGDAVANWTDGVFCLDDPASGPALFRIADRMKAVRCNLPRERSEEERTKRVCFGEQGSAVVTGSDHGSVYVFDTRTGLAVQKLDSGFSDWVQAVATAEIEGVSVIFAARTRALDTAEEEIFVWKRARSASIGWENVGMVLRALVVLGCAAFIYQNLAGPFKPWMETTFVKSSTDSVVSGDSFICVDCEKN